MIGILSVFAQLERETILERTRLGLKKRAEDGLWRGGGKTPFAYDYDKNAGKLVINPERKMLFDMMKSLRIQGFSYHQLEALTGIDESMIQNILNSKTNLGLIPYKGEYYEGKHEPVITQDEYNQLMEVEKNRRKSKGAKHYLLSGKIYCGKCGAKYRYQKWGKRVICYCYSQQTNKPKLIKDPNCNNKRLDSFEIEDSLLENLFSMGIDENKFRETFNLTKTNVEEELKSRLDKLAKKLDNLVLFIADGIAVEETKNKMKNLTEERTTIEEKIKNIKKEKKLNKTFEEIKNLSVVWNFMSFEEQRNVIEHLVDKVVVDNNTLSIKWKISAS